MPSSGEPTRRAVDDAVAGCMTWDRAPGPDSHSDLLIHVVEGVHHELI